MAHVSLIVETGSVVAGANSYISLVDAHEFVHDRGYAENLTEGLLLRAMDHLNAIPLRGFKTAATNPLPFPRSGMYDNDGYSIASDIVPQQIINAQIWIAYYIAAGSDPGAVVGPAISSETVDVIEVEYAVVPGQTNAITLLNLPNVRDSLKGLTRSNGRSHRA